MNKGKLTGTGLVWFVLLMIAGCLFTIQYITLPRIKAFVLSSSLNDHTQVIRRNAMKLLIDNWATILTPFDLFMISLLCFLLLALVFSELLRDRLSAFLSKLSGNPKALTWFLLVTSILITRYYLNPGNVFMGDSETYTVRSWMVAEHLKNMQFPVWSNYWYGGFPLLQFYAPLLFVVIAIFHLIFQDINLALSLSCGPLI